MSRKLIVKKEFFGERPVGPAAEGAGGAFAPHGGCGRCRTGGPLPLTPSPGGEGGAFLREPPLSGSRKTRTELQCVSPPPLGGEPALSLSKGGRGRGIAGKAVPAPVFVLSDFRRGIHEKGDKPHGPIRAARPLRRRTLRVSARCGLIAGPGEDASLSKGVCCRPFPGPFRALPETVQRWILA